MKKVAGVASRLFLVADEDRSNPHRGAQTNDGGGKSSRVSIMCDIESDLKVSDPIFTVGLSGGLRMGGLFDILEAVIRGEAVDLPAVRAHQRAAVVTVFAVVGHVLRRYGDASLAEEWDRQIGRDALRITAPHDEPAFLQPPTGMPTKRQSIESLDCLLPRVQHEVKETFSGSVEEWIFALMGGLARPSVNFNRPSSRQGLTAILPSLDGTIGSEIRLLIEAYDRTMDSREGSVADHMVWLCRLDKDSSPLVAEDLPRPVLDASRPVRLRLVEGRIEASLCPSNVYRIKDGNRWMDDPHTPKLVTAAGVERFRLAAKRWGHAVQHLMLFGGPREKDEVRRPEILHAVDYRFVRICALGTAQGKTRGYREALYAASRGGRVFRLTPPRDTADRAGDLSRRVLDAPGAGEKQLCAALLRMLDIDTFETLKHRPMEKATVEDAAARLRSLAGARSVQLVFDLLSEEHRPDAEQRRIHRFVGPEVRAVFAEARSASHDPLLAAEAEDYLLGRIVSQFGNEAMQDNEDIPRLARASRAALHEIVAHLTPDDRATLRTMPLGEPPMAFWIHLATAPVDQSELPAATEVWKVVLRTLGTIRQAGKPAGAVLAQTGFPRARMSRLLTATGQALTGAIDEAGRWLIARDVDKADMADLLALGLADALSDAAALDWARRRIALDYARMSRRQGEPKLREAS